MNNLTRNGNQGRHAPYVRAIRRRRGIDPATSVFLWLMIVAVLVYAFAPWF